MAAQLKRGLAEALRQSADLKPKDLVFVRRADKASAKPAW